MRKILVSTMVTLLLAGVGASCSGGGDALSEGDAVAEFCTKAHSLADAASRQGYEIGAVEVPDETTEADREILATGPELRRQGNELYGNVAADLSVPFETKTQLASCLAEVEVYAP